MCPTREEGEVFFVSNGEICLFSFSSSDRGEMSQRTGVKDVFDQYHRLTRPSYLSPRKTTCLQPMRGSMES